MSSGAAYLGTQVSKLQHLCIKGTEVYIFVQCSSLLIYLGFLLDWLAGRQKEGRLSRADSPSGHHFHRPSANSLGGTSSPTELDTFSQSFSW